MFHQSKLNILKQTQSMQTNKYIKPIKHRSYLYAPFVVSGQAPEGCSSYTFPQLFGVRFANEILYHGVKVTPEKAVSSGFASGLFQQNELVPKVMEIAKGLAANPMGSILQTKKVKKQHKQQKKHKHKQNNRF